MLRKKKPPLTELQKIEQQRQRDQLVRSKRQMFFLTILIWIVFFLILRDSFKLGGSPLVMFILMLGLLFVIFFAVRVGSIKAKFWWRNLTRRLARFAKRFRRQ